MLFFANRKCYVLFVFTLCQVALFVDELMQEPGANEEIQQNALLRNCTLLKFHFFTIANLNVLRCISMRDQVRKIELVAEEIL